MDFSSLNKGTVNFKNYVKDVPFKKFSDIAENSIFTVLGIIPINGKFGLQFFVNCKDNADNTIFNFDLPTNQNENCVNIRNNTELVELINNGKCGIKFSKYHNKKFNKECVNCEWIDL